MLSEDKIMDAVEAFDLTRSYRSAAQLCGVSSAVDPPDHPWHVRIRRNAVRVGSERRPK